MLRGFLLASHQWLESDIMTSLDPLIASINPESLIHALSFQAPESANPAGDLFHEDGRWGSPGTEVKSSGVTP